MISPLNFHLAVGTVQYDTFLTVPFSLVFLALLFVGSCGFGWSVWSSIFYIETVAVACMMESATW